VFRDGVSDGQLQHVLDREVPLIEAACKSIYGKYGRPLPWLYVQSTQKSTIARFYGRAGDKSDTWDPKRNPLPGLVIDEDVVHKDLSDWYSLGHKCLQGTSRPAHHYVVHARGVPLNVDDIEELTHALSYGFGRSVTSIRDPAPTRYAHCLCERAKVYLKDVYEPNPANRGLLCNPRDHFVGHRDVHLSLQNMMFYI
jgi:eukaryotic translation initiation factor 2C